jgi:hypothetical protein
VSAFPPDAHRIDPLQLRTLVWLGLKQSLGPGTDASTGSKGNPLLQVVLSMNLIGVVLAMNVSRSADLPSFLVLVFAAAFVIVVLAVNPDAEEVQQRRQEIVGSKPIAPRTLVAARAIVLLVIAGLVALCLGLVPIAVALARFRYSWPRAGATYLSLALGSASAAILWLAALMVSARWVSLERIRKTSQLLLVVVMTAVTVLSLGWIPGTNGTFSVSARPGLLLLPSSWFATLWLPEPLPSPFPPAAAALALMMGAVLVGARGVIDRHYPNFADQGAVAVKRPPRSLMAPLLGLTARLPLLGSLLLPPPVQAIATAVVTAAQREDVSRAKVLGPQALAVVAFAVGLSGAQLSATLTMLVYLGFSAVIDGLQVIRQSSHPAASWVFHGAPVSGRELVRGVTLALSLRFLAVPAVLLAILLLRSYPPPLAAVSAVGYLGAARLLVPLGLLLRPAYPLSQEQRSAQSLWGVALGLPLTVAAALLHGLLVILTEAVGSVMIGVAAAFVAALYIAAWGLGWAAASRLARLEAGG